MTMSRQKKPNPVAAKREPLYKGLFHTVRRRIELGQLQPGTRAPSESDLIFEFRVSSTTARRCLNDLETAGYVERLQGKGTFVRPPPALLRTRQVGVLYNELFSLGETFLAKELCGIGSALHGVEFQPALLSGGLIRRSSNPSAALGELVELHGVEALILLSPIPVSWLSKILDDGLPVASINFRYLDPRIAYTVPDIDRAYERITKRLHELGHKRVVEISRTFPSDLLEGVRLTRHSRGEMPDFDWRSESFSYFEPSQTQQIVERQLAAPSPATAFVTLGYELALEVRQAVRACGKLMPQDVSMVFVGAPTGPTDLTGEIVSVEEMGKWATQLVVSAVGKEKVMASKPKLFPTKTNPGITLAKVKG